MPWELKEPLGVLTALVGVRSGPLTAIPFSEVGGRDIEKACLLTGKEAGVGASDDGDTRAGEPRAMSPFQMPSRSRRKLCVRGSLVRQKPW